jgi:hypothetical protein
MKGLPIAVSLAVALATAPAAAGQKFCAPEGTLEINPTSVHYAPKKPTDKAKVVLATVKTKSGFDAIVATRAGEGVAFMPDAQAHYTADYGFPQPKWQGWGSCD